MPNTISVYDRSESANSPTLYTINLEGMRYAELVQQVRSILPAPATMQDTWCDLDEYDTDELPPWVMFTDPQGYAVHLFKPYSSTGPAMWPVMDKWITHTY